MSTHSASPRHWANLLPGFRTHCLTPYLSRTRSSKDSSNSTYSPQLGPYPTSAHFGPPSSPPKISSMASPIFALSHSATLLASSLGHSSPSMLLPRPGSPSIMLIFPNAKRGFHSHR